MRDYTATPTNPTILACHKLTLEASSLIPNNSLADDLARIFDPTQPAQQEFDDYSLSRTDMLIKISIASVPTAEIPLAYVPLIIDDLTAVE